MLPISPAQRQTAPAVVPGHDAADLLPGTGDRLLRRRLSGGPVAPLKIASGCDRRCAFCAIPSFRGAFVSRPPADIVAEAASLIEQGVVEIVLVSENSTAYGKDLPGGPGLDGLLRSLAQLPGLQRIRPSYLQPAEIRPGLLDAMAELPSVAPSYDISFQHASGPLLRRMRRFGDDASFLGLIDQIRTRVPEAGIRSNVIVGFPGETEQDVEVLMEFLGAARLDAVGVFGYSDEEGTEAARLSGGIDPDEIAARVAAVGEAADAISTDRAGDRIGARVEVLVERPADGDAPVGRAAFQGPEDGGCRWIDGVAPPAVGSVVGADVVDCDGVDLVVVPEVPSG